LYRLTARDYFQMVEADIIPPGRRVGLWEGVLFEKMAKKPPHSVSAGMVGSALSRALPPGWCVWAENPILVNDFTAPLPDVTVVRGTYLDYYRRRSVPGAGDIGLVVEVADSSLRKNLDASLQTYARAGLPTYWVVNLVDQRVDVFSQPDTQAEPALYTSSQRFGLDDEVPLTLDGREVTRIPVRELLPTEAQ
jgi:Uma2 family endonuclease